MPKGGLTPAEECIQEQVRVGKEEGAKYHEYTSEENRRRYFGKLPHSPGGWMRRAMSPQDCAFLEEDKGRTDVDTRRLFVIDPARIPDSILPEGSITDRLSAWREWLVTSRPIISSGRMMSGTDGRIIRFQEHNIPMNGGKGKIPRAHMYIHRSMYDALGSHYHAGNKLQRDIDTIETLSPEIIRKLTEILNSHSDQHTMQQELQNWISGMLTEFDRDETSLLLRNFHLRKMLIHYLLKLDQKQYRDTRVFWALQTLKDGIKDRKGKMHGISTGLELGTQAKDIELYHWIHIVLGETGKERVSLESLFKKIDTQKGWGEFIQRLEIYKPRKIFPTFEPFFSFYNEWRLFLKDHPNNKILARQILVRQFTLITLSEAKIRYLYQDSIPQKDAVSLNTRMQALQNAAQSVCQPKDTFNIDFGTENNTIDTIKTAVKEAIDSFTLPLLK